MLHLCFLWGECILFTKNSGWDAGIRNSEFLPTSGTVERYETESSQPPSSSYTEGFQNKKIPLTQGILGIFASAVVEVIMAL